MREVVLAARPQGEPQESDFAVREAADVPLADGDVRIRNELVSVDPYMRGRMTGIRTYVGPYEVGDVIDGAAVGRVVESQHAGFGEGDWVLSQIGWCEQGVAPVVVYFAMGDRAQSWLEGLPGYWAFGMTADGAAWRTTGFADTATTPSATSRR